MSDHDEQRWITAIRQRLDTDTATLDGRTVERLRQARRQALAVGRNRAMPARRPLIVATGLAVLMLGVWRQPPEPPPDLVASLPPLVVTEPPNLKPLPLPVVDAPEPLASSSGDGVNAEVALKLSEIELLESEESIEFFADLEFYAWLGDLPHEERATP